MGFKPKSLVTPDSLVMICSFNLHNCILKSQTRLQSERVLKKRNSYFGWRRLRIYLIWVKWVVQCWLTTPGLNKDIQRHEQHCTMLQLQNIRSYSWRPRGEDCQIGDCRWLIKSSSWGFYEYIWINIHTLYRPRGITWFGHIYLY